MKSKQLTTHEEKILQMRGKRPLNEHQELELASDDPIVARRLLALEASVFAAARTRIKHAAHNDDE